MSTIIKPKSWDLPRLDSAENIFFARELEQISQEMFDIKYATLKARMLVPVDNSIDPGAETWTYRQYEFTGSAEIITPDGGKDIPMVNAEGAEYTSPIRSFAAGYTYTLQEIRAAAKAGRALERMRAMAARRALDVKLDDIAAFGDTASGITGLLNLANTTTFTPADKSNGGKTWLNTDGTPNATPTEIIKDLSDIITTVVVETLEVERPTRILLPTRQFEHITNTPRSDVSDTTIRAFFEGTHPGVQLMSWERLALSASSGTLDQMVAYNPSPMNLRLLMAVEFEQLPPQQDGFAYKVLTHMRTGGVVTQFPKSIAYGAGI
jgi:hypothetical protein